MSNPPKAKGTAAETATLRWLRQNGFPWTERLTLTGIHDRGDLSLLPGAAVIAEIKNHATAATGQPGDALLTKWMTETETERTNAGADHAALIVKRKGTTDVGRWFCYLPLGHLVRLDRANPADVGTHKVTDLWPAIYGQPVCIDVATWVELLRRGGWGTPSDDMLEEAAS